MRISSLRSVLYRSARILGDVQAVTKSVEKRSAAPAVRRVKNRLLGRAAGRILRKL